MKTKTRRQIKQEKEELNFKNGIWYSKFELVFWILLFWPAAIIYMMVRSQKYKDYLLKGFK